MAEQFTAEESEIIGRLLEEHHLRAAGLGNDNQRLLQLRRECRSFSAGQTIPQRLAIMTELNRRLLVQRGIAFDHLEGDKSVRFVKSFQKTS